MGCMNALESSSTSWLGQISRLIFKIIAILTTYESDFLRNFTHRSSLMLNEMNMMANWPVCDVNWPSRDVSVLVEALGNAAKWNLKIRPTFSYSASSLILLLLLLILPLLLLFSSSFFFFSNPISLLRPRFGKVAKTGAWQVAGPFWGLRVIGYQYHSTFLFL